MEINTPKDAGIYLAKVFSDRLAKRLKDDFCKRNAQALVTFIERGTDFINEVVDAVDIEALNKVLTNKQLKLLLKVTAMWVNRYDEEERGFLLKDLKVAKAERESSRYQYDTYYRNDVDSRIKDLNGQKKEIKWFVKAVYAEVGVTYPDMTIMDRCIIVSEIMNALGLYEREPFMTLEEAENYALRNDVVQSGKQVIYDRIKRFL